MDFWSRQEQARKKTMLLVVYFMIAVVAIIFSVSGAIWLLLFAMTLVRAGARMSRGYPEDFNDMHLITIPDSFIHWLQSPFFILVTFFTIAVILIGSLSRISQLSGGGKAVADMVGARRVLPETDSLNEKKLINVVEEMSIASGVCHPRVYVLDREQGINAFVAGINPQETVLVVTRGMLEQLSRDELQGMVGHEYSHIVNGDMQLNVRLLGLLAGILLIGQCGFYLLYFICSHSRKVDPFTFALAYMLIGLGSVGLFFGRLIKAAVSRQREFLADAAAVQYTRNINIAGALAKIGMAEQGSLLEMPYAEEIGHMCFGASVNVSLSRLLATHPTISERIQALGFAPDAFMQTIERKKTDKTDEIKKSIAKKIELYASKKAATTLATIGTMNDEQLRYAQQIKAEISDTLNEGIHNRLQVANVLIALLIGENSAIESMALLHIARKYGEDKKAAVVQWLPDIKNLQPPHRLALIYAMRAALEFLQTAEREQLILLLDELTKLDVKITPFEYVLTSLARKWLQPLTPKPVKPITNFNKVTDALSVVLGFMVGVSGNDLGTQKNRYQNALASFSIPFVPMPVTFEAGRLTEALTQLDRLGSLLKRTLINTLVELIMVDRHATVEEVELLRAMCEQLGCPMPLLLPT